MNIVIYPAFGYLKEFIYNIPSLFLSEGNIIYEGRNVLKLFDVGEQKLVVKSFKPPHFINKFVYSFIRLSKAKRSYKYGLLLKKKGINTPKPVACIEDTKFGLLNHSYYISEHLNYDGMMRELNTGKLEGREEFLRQFAQFTAFIHEQNVLHLDYSPGNILYKKTEDSYVFYLVDINRMSFRPVNMKQACKNLQKLCGNNEMIAFIATEYAKTRGFDVNECVRLTLFYHEKFWKKFSKRYKEERPYYE